MYAELASDQAFIARDAQEKKLQALELNQKELQSEKGELLKSVNKAKAETFIGFAMRTGKYKIGTNAVQTLKRAYLVIVCKSASDNTKKECDKLAKKFHAPIVETTDRLLSDYVHKENAKVMAIADKSLAQAILDNAENYFIARILGDKNG